MKIGFIGAGKVGFSLGKLFVENNIQVTGYYSQHLESAKEAATFTNSNSYSDVSKLIHDSDAIFITVNDGQIKKVYEEIKEKGIQGKAICHCSGAMKASDAFYDVSLYGARGYSIHPLFPVSSKYESYKDLMDAFFCLEGDAGILEMQELLSSINIKTRIISGDHKVKYHCACAISSNLVCALLKQSMDMLMECGFTEMEARTSLQPLALSNLNRIFEVGAVDALTGPMERCDTETIQKHLDCFENEEDLDLYKSVSKKLLSMAKEKHPGSNYDRMQDLLMKYGGTL